MKKYVKNKNFTPENFIDKIQQTSNEKNNRLIILLLIVNIFIIPKTISKISNELEYNKSVSVSSINNNPKEIYKDSNKDKLIIIMNSINEIKKMNIGNNRGFIEVDSIEDVFNIEEKKDFKIKSVDIKNNIITVEVELWKRSI